MVERCRVEMEGGRRQSIFLCSVLRLPKSMKTCCGTFEFLTPVSKLTIEIIATQNLNDFVHDLSDKSDDFSLN